MKKITLTIICNLIMTFTNAQETKTHFDNGQIKEIGFLDENGKKTGEWKGYYPSGEIYKTINYNTGCSIGKEKRYYETGEIKEITNNTKSERIAYYKSGEIKETYNYSKEYPTKEKKGYYETGEIEYTIIYNANYKRKGESKYYYKSGEISKIQYHKTGTNLYLQKKYYKNGKLEEVATFKGSKLVMVGSYKHFMYNGNLDKIGKYDRDGLKDGKWKYYNLYGGSETIRYKNGIDKIERIEERIDYIIDHSKKAHLYMNIGYNSGVIFDTGITAPLEDIFDTDGDWFSTSLGYKVAYLSKDLYHGPKLNMSYNIGYLLYLSLGINGTYLFNNRDAKFIIEPEIGISIDDIIALKLSKNITKKNAFFPENQSLWSIKLQISLHGKISGSLF